MLSLAISPKLRKLFLDFAYVSNNRDLPSKHKPDLHYVYGIASFNVVRAILEINRVQCKLNLGSGKPC